MRSSETNHSKPWRNSCEGLRESTWRAWRMLANFRVSNSPPLAICSGPMSCSEASVEWSSPCKLCTLKPRWCNLATQISKPMFWLEASWWGQNQYMLVDAGKGRQTSCNVHWEIRERSLESSSCDESRLNQSARVNLSPSVTCKLPLVTYIYMEQPKDIQTNWEAILMRRTSSTEWIFRSSAVYMITS